MDTNTSLGKMLYKNLNEFMQVIPKNRCIMCLDMGEKNIGIAFSDKTHLIATASNVYSRRNTSKDLGYFHRITKENDIGSVVVGLPLEANGQENEWCKKIVQFANKLANKCSTRIYLQDESFSTQIAISTLKFAGISTTKSRKIDDKVSACIILQKTLDKIKPKRSSI